MKETVEDIESLLGTLINEHEAKGFIINVSDIENSFVKIKSDGRKVKYEKKATLLIYF